MAAKRKTAEEVHVEEDLSETFSKPAVFKVTQTWIVGTSPLITHAWSEKAKREMLSKQVKAVSPSKAAREPETEFNDSLYRVGKDAKTGHEVFGFPAMGLKNAILSCAHKDKGIPKTVVMQSLWLDAPIVRTRPALHSAICDMPLLRIYGSEPEMREDMVKIGAGIKKTASFAYRAQFSTWAMRLVIRFNASALNEVQIKSLIQESGFATGIGEWRNEKKGIFGAYQIGNIEEQRAWDAFAKNEGPLPNRAVFDMGDFSNLLDEAA